MAGPSLCTLVCSCTCENVGHIWVVEEEARVNTLEWASRHPLNHIRWKHI
jgi:hypothetical protein